MTTVDLSARLRQAIESKDLSLVKRILKNNPTYLQNPDYADKSNTSLHLAAQYGLTEFVELLLSLGHDDKQPPTEYIYLHAANNLGTSFNTDGHTALHLAASHGHTAIVRMLCEHFPSTINLRDKEGCTALHLASRAHPTPSTLTSTPAAKMSMRAPEDTATIETLLSHGADVHAQDAKGNTCLHYATAWGNLKAVRALVQAGADPLCSNVDGWTPEYYSVTVQAEVYYRNLVAEFERRKAEEGARLRERQVKRAGGVRLVAAVEDEGGSQASEEDGRSRASEEDGRSRADSGKSNMTTGTEGGLGISIGRDAWG